MTPAARIAAVIEILSELPPGEIASVSAGAALRRGLQARRYAGSSDRQAISALFWGVHRSLARLGWHLGELGQEGAGIINGYLLFLSGLGVYAFLDESLGHGAYFNNRAVQPDCGIDAMGE